MISFLSKHAQLISTQSLAAPILASSHHIALMESVLEKKIIRLRGYAHKQQKKPRTQDFTWFSKSLHPRSAPALNSHYIFQKRIQQ